MVDQVLLIEIKISQRIIISLENVSVLTSVIQYDMMKHLLDFENESPRSLFFCLRIKEP
ncbi:hypothetical protein D3C80_1761010 [compost metagenome]